MDANEAADRAILALLLTHKAFTTFLSKRIHLRHFRESASWVTYRVPPLRTHDNGSLFYITFMKTKSTISANIKTLNNDTTSTAVT